MYNVRTCAEKWRDKSIRLRADKTLGAQINVMRAVC